ncbi:YhgE/Pip domain-containing protein [Bifidobacterium oedipodis]|uniref:Phage infection protein n=1 Tax=Bifidobacterium oedipodis TaxID=2675322 RepID=A0A7Y0ENE5_9BIFI|nr:YhgE/Pip domain-containing protein [Bifidobacterium sp. DSM 109957]NMM93445.1 phage infection protein [Bifidobacterium sp. DSM 109957]
MTTIWRLFIGDVRRLFSNVVSVIIVIGLVAIPSLFAWFNIAASWDPFGNMSSLKFAVANTDEGYKSDLIPMKVTIGAEVVNTLRANTELDWTFTTKQEAIEGTKSGKYYAAIVIPKDFSATMMTFFSDDAKHASIEYYSNEKKNAVAPTITSKGADEVSTQVNQTFVETLTSTALNIASSIIDQLNQPEAQDAMGRFNSNVADFATQLTEAGDTLESFGTITDSAQALLTSSTALIKQGAAATDKAGDQLDEAKNSAGDVTDALNTSVDTLKQALTSSADSFEQAGKDADRLLGSAAQNASDTSTALRNQATAVGQQIEHYQSILNAVNSLPGAGSDTAIGKSISAIANSLQRTINQLTALQTKLNNAADSLDAKVNDAAAQRKEIAELIDQAKTSISDIATNVDADLAPSIQQITTAVGDVSTLLAQNADQLDTTVDELDNAADKAGKTVDEVRTMLSSTASKLHDAGDSLAAFNGKLSQALNSGDMSMVQEVLGANAESLSSALAAPVTLKRKAVFPVENFGSSMAPYYTFIPLWTASILIALAVRTSVSRKRRAELGDPKPYQMFLGRFGVFAVISLLQSTVSCAGSLLFLRVQAVHPLLFMLSGWVGGLVFALFIYTMVMSFGNVGKAIGMLMLVFQVSGSAGSYPLQVLPGFMQAINPFLPITHAINAMRAAIAGIYNNDYWIELGKLLMFVPPLLLLALVLYKPLLGFNRWITNQLERTKLIG